MDQQIIITSSFHSNQELLAALSSQDLPQTVLSAKEADETERSIAADPIIIGAVITGGVAIVVKLIDALVEVYKIGQEKKDKPAIAPPVLQITLQSSSEPLRIELSRLPEDGASRQTILATIPQLEEKVAKIELVEG